MMSQEGVIPILGSWGILADIWHDLLITMSMFGLKLGELKNTFTLKATNLSFSLHASERAITLEFSKVFL